VIQHQAASWKNRRTRTLSELEGNPQHQAFTEVAHEIGWLRHIGTGRITFEIESRGEARDITGVMKRNHHLVVKEQAAAVEVSGACQRQDIINDGGLGMQHVWREPDMHTCPGQGAQGAMPRDVGEPMVGAGGQQQVHFHAPPCRQTQRHQQGIVEHDVWRDQRNARTCALGGADEQCIHCVVSLVRTRGDDLPHRFARRCNGGSIGIRFRQGNRRRSASH